MSRRLDPDVKAMTHGARSGQTIQPLSLSEEEFLANCRRYYERNRKRK